LRDLRDDLISDDVAVGIIHGFEMIDIGEHDRNVVMGALQTQEFLGECFQDCRSVVGTGECVVRSLVGERILRTQEPMLSYDDTNRERSEDGDDDHA